MNVTDSIAHEVKLHMAYIGYIQVTRECNQQCLFCSNPPSGRTRSTADILQAAGALIEQGASGVILTGGEPTLFPQLPEVIEFCSSRTLEPRIITNCQKLADADYLAELYRAGLRHVHTSVYSHRAAVHDLLAHNPGSLANITQALKNLAQYPDLAVNLNTVLNAASIDHIHHSLDAMLTQYPFIHHIVINNMDPLFNRVRDNPQVIPSLEAIELAVFRIGRVLMQHGKSFRVERVPLCLMSEYAACSTETRKIVKEEARTVYFLDQRGKVQQEKWTYHKPPACGHCSLASICAGLYAGKEGLYDARILAPQFLNPARIIRAVGS